MSTYRCCAGPHDRPFAEQHEGYTLAIIREGSFAYHGEFGRRLLQPGALLLGNPQASYQCSHEESTGDTCLVLNFDAATWGEAAASCGTGLGQRFTVSAIPPLDALVPAIARLRRDGADAAPDLLCAVLAVQQQATGDQIAPSPRDLRAIRAVTAFIEEQLAEPVSLADLAGVAGLSRFHLLRCFRKVHRTTPYRYILARRLAGAAEQLANSRKGIAEIAYDAGFGDLSTFNARFKTAFGTSPSGWRKRA